MAERLSIFLIPAQVEIHLRAFTSSPGPRSSTRTFGDKLSGGDGQFIGTYFCKTL